ncbi:MAG: ATP-binding protein [Brevinematales bacterium]|nr:ATP-binding protein [Brevinematales bacterium]
MLKNDKLILIDYGVELFLKFKKFCDSKNIPLNLYSPAQPKKYNIFEYRKAIKKFNPVKGLSYEDKKIILLLLGILTGASSASGINLFTIFNFLHRIPSNSFFAFKKFINPDSRLNQSGIIMLSKIKEYEMNKENEDQVNILELSTYFNDIYVYLSPFFISSFAKNIGNDHKILFEYIINISNKPYKDLDRFIKDIASLIKYINFFRNYLKAQTISSKKVNSTSFYEKGEIKKYIERIKKNLLNSRIKTNLAEYIRNKKLSNIEFTLLLFFIYELISLKTVSIGTIHYLIEKFALSVKNIEDIVRCFRKDGILIKEGFVFIDEPFNFIDDINNDNMELPNFLEDEDAEDENNFKYTAEIAINQKKIYNLLFEQIENNNLFFGFPQEDAQLLNFHEDSSPRQKARANELYEIKIPTVKIENVILDENIKNELLGAVDLTKAADVMRQWGVKPNLSSSAFASIKILLYGASGTGKTLTAEALAGEAGAELFKVDASNLVSMWVGESTKNVRKVFKEFYKYVKETNKRVFLFINEADQLLSSRGVITQAADKEYNQMQNLLLEELENFDGVFIATTNLPDLFDSAWNRRFNLKIKFDIPSYETRLKLWKVHIPESMPLANDVDMNKLAEYELAGGSIANVVYNAARKAALRTGKDRVVRQKDFIDSINQEIKSHLGGKTSKVGF